MGAHLSRRRFVLRGGAALAALPSLALVAPAAAFADSASGGPANGTGGASSNGANSGSSSGSGGMARTLTDTVSGMLAAGRGGSFDYYQFAYPGDGHAVILTLSVDRPDALRDNAAGVAIYRDGALQTKSSQSTPNTATAIYTSSTGGPVTVQVFNYDPRDAIAYTLTTQGLGGSASSGNAGSTSNNGGNGSGSAGSGNGGATGDSGNSGSNSNGGGNGGMNGGAGANGNGGANGSTAGASATSPMALHASVSGRLLGSTGGAYDRYTFTYPGDGSTVRLTLTTDSVAAINTGAVGVAIYRGATKLTTSTRSGASQATAIFTSSIAGPIEVAVFDFDPRQPIAYTLTADGLPGGSGAR